MIHSRPESSTIKSTIADTYHSSTYLEWLRSQYPEEVKQLTKAELLAKLSELRRKRQ